MRIWLRDTYAHRCATCIHHYTCTRMHRQYIVLQAYMRSYLLWADDHRHIHSHIHRYIAIREDTETQKNAYASHTIRMETNHVEFRSNRIHLYREKYKFSHCCAFLSAVCASISTQFALISCLLVAVFVWLWPIASRIQIAPYYQNMFTALRRHGAFACCLWID